MGTMILLKIKNFKKLDYMWNEISCGDVTDEDANKSQYNTFAVSP